MITEHQIGPLTTAIFVDSIKTSMRIDNILCIVLDNKSLRIRVS